MLPKTLTVLRKFGRVRLGARDFVTAVDQNKIEVVSSSEIQRGFYYYSRNKHTIVLPTGIDGEERLIVAWHEFAHFLQNFHHKRMTAAFCGLKDDAPGERQAVVFSRIAVHPENISITGPIDFLKMIMRTKL